jgi:hypothetical protein
MVQRHLGILLLLWWGGLNCLTGCLIAPTSVIGESHCSMSDEGACCLSEANDQEPPSSKSIGGTSTSLQPLNCCSLESLTAELTHNVRAVGNTVLTTATLSLIGFTPEVGPRAEMPERLARLPDRRGTHLLCCVFLI